MEAALLMFDAAGIVLVLIWVIRGQGSDGIFGWRGGAASDTPGRTSGRKRSGRA